MTRMQTGAPFANTGVTTDVAAVTIVSYDLSNGQNKDGVAVGPPLDDCVVHAKLLLLGRQGSNYARLHRERAFARASGVLSALDNAALSVTGLSDFLSAALATAGIVLETNGTVIRGRATGIAATNITWTGYLWLYSGEYVG